MWKKHARNLVEFFKVYWIRWNGK